MSPLVAPWLSAVLLSAPPPAAATGAEPAPFVPAAFVPATRAAADAPPLAAVGTFCVVALAERRFAPARPAHHAVHAGRTWFFSSDAARAAFLAAPDAYAPAYCGFDPVAYLDDGELTEGTVLRRHAGRFYLFADAANWERFRANPARYAR